MPRPRGSGSRRSARAPPPSSRTRARTTALSPRRSASGRRNGGSCSGESARQPRLSPSSRVPGVATRHAQWDHTAALRRRRHSGPRRPTKVPVAAAAARVSGGPRVARGEGGAGRLVRRRVSGCGDAVPGARAGVGDVVRGAGAPLPVRGGLRPPGGGRAARIRARLRAGHVPTVPRLRHRLLDVRGGLLEDDAPLPLRAREGEERPRAAHGEQQQTARHHDHETEIGLSGCGQ
mmetsp:Transcript_13250/g.44566  ORF Transcript_13250/g.44566 Transcript_13250/m.44566 type:complete len:234 (+) Transcript_13250:1508-2209(+)